MYSASGATVTEPNIIVSNIFINIPIIILYMVIVKWSSENDIIVNMIYRLAKAPYHTGCHSNTKKLNENYGLSEKKTKYRDINSMVIKDCLFANRRLPDQLDIKLILSLIRFCTYNVDFEY